MRWRTFSNQSANGAPITKHRPGFADQLIYEGTQRAQAEARETLMEMKKAMGLTGVWNRIRRSNERRQKRLAKAQTAG